MIAIITPISDRDGGGRPDNSLPGGGRPDNSLPGGGFPTRPDNSLPGGGYPSHGLPGGPDRPDNSLPPLPPPLVDNDLPDQVWPGVPVYPSTPENPIALPPGTIYPPLPPTVSGKALVLVYVVGAGHRWVVIENAQPK